MQTGIMSLLKYSLISSILANICKDLVKLGGITLLHKYNSLPQLLAVAYPEYPWKPFEFKSILSNDWNEILQGRESFLWCAYF